MAKAGGRFAASRFHGGRFNLAAGQRSAWSPARLLTGASQLAYYDPSDLSTLFQDSAGTTPVTADGQSVGLVLYKSKGAGYSGGSFTGLGSELVTNGTFATNDLTGWIDASSGGTVSVANEQVTLSRTAGTPRLRQALTVEVGKTYLFSFDLINTNPTNRAAVYVGSTATGSDFLGAQIPVQGTNSYVLTATTTTIGMTFYTETLGFDPVFDNISVRELPGNHLIQSTAGSRPLYGFHPATGVRNLLTKTEEFDNAAWSKVNAVASGSRITATAVTGAAYAEFAFANAPATTLTISFIFAATPGRNRYVWIADRGIVGLASATFDLDTLSIIGSNVGTTASVSALADGSVRCAIAYTRSTVGTSSPQFALAGVSHTSDRPSLTWAGGEFLEAKAQFEIGSTATAYQKVNTVHGVTEAGVPTVHFLKFDGTDDFLVSAASVNPGSVDKAQVFAGVRKASDAARGTIAELSTSIASANGGFHLTAPNAASDTFAFESKGTTLTDAIATGVAAPATRVLTGLGDISGDSAILRVNGVQADADTGDQGTGNYLSAAIYVGRRGGTSLPFNGNLYSLIVRFSAANLDAAVIDQAEAWTAGKCGVTL